MDVVQGQRVVSQFGEEGDGSLEFLGILGRKPGDIEVVKHLDEGSDSLFPYCCVPISPGAWENPAWSSSSVSGVLVVHFICCSPANSSTPGCCMRIYPESIPRLLPGNDQIDSVR